MEKAKKIAETAGKVIGYFLLFAAVALLFSWLATLGGKDSSPPPVQQVPVPGKPERYVKDTAGALSKSEEEKLDNMLAKYDKDTGIRMVVLYVKTTNNEDIEYYSNRVTSAWGMGQKDDGNSILIIITTDGNGDDVLCGAWIEGSKGIEQLVSRGRAIDIIRSAEVESAALSRRWYDETFSIVSQIQKCIKTRGLSAEHIPTLADQKAGEAGILLAVLILCPSIIMIFNPRHPGAIYVLSAVATGFFALSLRVNILVVLADEIIAFLTVHPFRHSTWI